MITQTKVEKSKIVERIQINGMDLFRVETESGEWGAEYEWATCNRPTDRRHKSETVVFLSEYTREWFAMCSDDTIDVKWCLAHENGYDTCIEIGVTRIFGLDSNETEGLRAMYAISTWELMRDED